MTLTLRSEEVPRQYMQPRDPCNMIFNLEICTPSAVRPGTAAAHGIATLPYPRVLSCPLHLLKCMLLLLNTSVTRDVGEVQMKFCSSASSSTPTFLLRRRGDVISNSFDMIERVGKLGGCCQIG